MKNLKIYYFVVLILLNFSFTPGNVSAKDEWLQVRSKNFNLFGNAKEKDIRKVATKLEQFRETFRRVFNKTNLNSSIPTNVIVFKSDNAYKPFKPKRADGKTDNLIAGYFQSGEDVNYITLSTEGDDADTYGTIFHEYVHFINNSNFGKSEIPPWVDEGLAEYYQIFQIENDQTVKLGLPQNSHLALLQQNKFIPLETLFSISNYTLHQNENHSRSIFYAESWALIHYLVQNKKTEGLSKFLTLSANDVPSEKAFKEAFQLSYAQMENELRKYVGQNRYFYSIVNFPEKLVFDKEMQTTILSEAESNAYLGDLLYHTNRDEDAEIYLQKAIALTPDSSMANTTYGMVKMRQRKYDDAKNYFEKAIAENQKNHLAFYNYAFLLSREGRDEFGYVHSFSKEQSIKIRDLLKKAIAINPAFTESYELIAFVDLVNNEELDEGVAYLQKALRYQPGNQKYAIRLAEIYLRQDKFAESRAIAEKIAKTTDDPQIKQQVENLVSNLQKREEYVANAKARRKQNEEAIATGDNNEVEPIFIRRRTDGKKPTPEELAKEKEEDEIFSMNRAIRKAQSSEVQSLGHIQKIECKNNAITYTVKTESETFILSSKDFEGLSLVALVANLRDTQIGCDAKIAAVKAVITYKPQPITKNASRGELIAIDFVPNNFRFMDAGKYQVIIEDSEDSATLSPPAPEEKESIDKKRKELIIESIKKALRQPQSGEKRDIGFLEKIECTNKGMYFYLKGRTQTFKLTTASPQAIQLLSFTPESEALELECNLKPVDVPVVFTYKVEENLKVKSNGEIISLEFVPKSFTLDN